MSTPANDLAAMLAELTHNDREREIAECIKAILAPTLDELAKARDVLAVIHCDGGHHTAEVGFVQSCEDAIKRRCDDVARLDDAETALRAARVAMARVLSFRVGEPPYLGWLPDNDLTRDALTGLAEALAALPPHKEETK